MKKKLLSLLATAALLVAPASAYDLCPNNGYCVFDQWVHVGNTVQYVLWYTSWCSTTGNAADCKYSMVRTFDTRVDGGDWGLVNQAVNPHTREVRPSTCGGQADSSSVLNMPDDNVGYYGTTRDFRMRIQVYDTSGAGGGIVVQDDYVYYMGYIPS